MSVQEERLCKVCNRSFQVYRRNGSLYCSSKCYHVDYFGRRNHLARNSGDTGAAGEMIACADLLLKGWEVFRAVSPSASCDIIAMKDGRVLRIQVKCGNVTPSGRLASSRSSMDKSDFVAVVILSENRVIYTPEWPENQ